MGIIVQINMPGMILQTILSERLLSNIRSFSSMRLLVRSAMAVLIQEVLIPIVLQDYGSIA